MKIPKKSLGQNFLLDKNIGSKIISQIKVTGNNIIEIGPGNGILTDIILENDPKELIIIEKDDDLTNNLKKKYKNNKKVKIINDDVKNINFCKFKNTKIISNLPYNISTKIILKLLLELNKSSNEMVFMIQKEVAEKFKYYKNKKINKYNFFIKICTDYKIVFNVSNQVFYPKPKVDSSVVYFKIKNNLINKKNLLNFCNTIFINQRKKIKNNIKYDMKNLRLLKIIEQRVENTKIEDLLYLFNKS